jgi:hypothetical protein
MKTFKFYGVCGNCYKLNEIVWEALKDENDGYRSYLKSIEISEEKEKYAFTFYPIAEVKVIETKEEYGFSGFCLIDINDGHVWLKIGTNYRDDYYPYFVFNYEPKPPKETWEHFISEDNE